MVKDINTTAGTNPGTTNSSGPSFLTNVNGTLFFRANDGVNGFELWKSDGFVRRDDDRQGHQDGWPF